MRKHWIDNLRWVTVLLVLLYHVIYFYNNKGVFGGVGGFGDDPQYQDVLMYVLYPWFMPLLFLLAGIGSRYALERKTAKEWFKARTRKLLVPATIGLLVFQWMTGYFNTHVAGTDVMAAVPQPIKYFMWAISGTGPLWFIQDLWLFSLILLLIRKIDAKDRFYTWCGKLGIIWIILLGVLFWLGEQTLIFNPRPESLDGLYNLYKPVFYFIPFLLGYYIFSRDEVQDTLGKAWLPLLAAAVVSGVLLTVTTFGQNNTVPQYLASPLNCIYGWLMCLAMMGWFKAKFDKTSLFAQYMTHSSFGIYIVHYLVIASLGYMMKVYTTLPPMAMYLILTVAVLTISPLLYEVLRRIPVINWCVLGEKLPRKGNKTTEKGVTKEKVNNMKKNIALVMGGFSGEHDISIASGNQVYGQLDHTKYNVYKIVIDRDGWYWDRDGEHLPIDRGNFTVIDNGTKVHFDLAFIIVHGNPGENGVLQGYFDMLGIRYTTCGFYTSALTFQKGYCNPVVKSFGIVKVAKSVLLYEEPRDLSPLSTLHFPLFVKPAAGGSSVATTKVKTAEQLLPAIREAFTEDHAVLVEECIVGREFDCGVFRKADGEKLVFPITEIIPKGGHEFFDYEAKYQGFSNEVTPAECPERISMHIQEVSSKLYDLLGCKGIVRFDYIHDTAADELYFLEVNTIPGQSAESIVPKQARAVGISPAELYEMSIQAALK